MKTINRRQYLALSLGLLGAGTAALTGCAAPQIVDYAAEKPALDLRRYFNGKLTAHGLFKDRAGKVKRRFVVAMDCRWDGDSGVFDEQFVYSDGEKQRRVWRLRYLGDGRYSGQADDVVGTAEGATQGNAFRWQYTLRLPVDGREIDVQFDDWMYLIDERVMLNQATMSKFGVTLGEVQLSFDKGG